MTRAHVVGAIVAVLATGSVGALSQMPWALDNGRAALIRFSWRAAGERVEECREPTAADLEGLPAHMRPAEICERRMKPFRLMIRVDGESVANRVVRASGAQEDRPIYVFVERAVTPGPHRIQIDFRSIDEGTADSVEGGSDGVARDSANLVLDSATVAPDSATVAQDSTRSAPTLTMDRELLLDAGEIVVIGLRDDGSGFEVLTGLE